MYKNMVGYVRSLRTFPLIDQVMPSRSRSPGETKSVLLLFTSMLSLFHSHAVRHLASENTGARDGVRGDGRPVDVDLDSGVRTL